MRRIFLVTAFLLGFAVFRPAPAEAYLIIGELDLAGGVIIHSDGLLDFTPSVGCPGADCGMMDISKTSNTGYFSVFNGLVQWHIADLDLDGSIYTDGPPGTFPELEDFETTPAEIQGVYFPDGTFFPFGVSPKPELTFSLTAIITGNGASFGFDPRVSVSETDNGKGGKNTAVIMNVLGIVCDPGTVGAECNDYIGTFTAQFPDRTAQSLVDELDDVGFIQTSISASKLATPAVPEPASLLLFGTGSALLAARARRRAKANKAAI